jgi:hypothetical protein
MPDNLPMSEYDHELHEITEEEREQVLAAVDNITRRANELVVREKGIEFGLYQLLGRRVLSLHISTAKFAANKLFGINDTGL